MVFRTLAVDGQVIEVNLTHSLNVLLGSVIKFGGNVTDANSSHNKKTASPIMEVPPLLTNAVALVKFTEVNLFPSNALLPILNKLLPRAVQFISVIAQPLKV